LTERIEVTGDPVVELYASSSAPDTDWFVRLIDVHPDGLALDISYGVVRARYRYGLDKPKLIESGEVVKYTIQMRSTSNAFLPGHRIRLDITSSDFPRWDRNHNTAADQNADATLVTAKQTIYHCGEHATRIILPWIPNTSGEEQSVEAESEPVSEKQIYPLHPAAASGNIEQVRLLLSKGIGVNTKDEEGNHALHNAVESGKLEVVRLLVEAGADVNLGSWPPLCVAVDENNLAIAEYLIAQGADVNAPEGWTALQEAPYIENNIEMVKLLIANGADINAGPFTALHAAASKGRTDIVKLLVQNGANINIEDSRSTTPLEYALSENRGDIARLLLERMTDSTSKDKGGLTSLHYAAAHGFQDIIELLLDKGAKINGRDDIYNFTPLHYAARFGTTKFAEVLINHGADIRAKDNWDYEPMHWAAYHDRPEIIELLIAKGADVNVKTSLGQTPLELAIPRRNTASIEVLRKHGARE
jgi:ankyrin repeat protein